MDKKIIRDGLIARKNLKHDQCMIDRITKQLAKCNERYDQIIQEIINSHLPTPSVHQITPQKDRTITT